MGKLNCQDAKKMNLVEILSQLGMEPKIKNSKEWWYCSPFRNESKPSFKVNLEVNIWYDFGLGEGGGTLDFVMKYFSIDVRQALNKLREFFSFQQPGLASLKVLDSQKIDGGQEPSFQIKKVAPLNNKALLDYLSLRCIDVEIGQQFLEEIYYKIADKHYFSLSFSNDCGGREISNKYGKWCLGKKGISFFKGSNKRCLIFEGVFDFLSALIFYDLSKDSYQSSVLVLNSVMLKESALSCLIKEDQEKVLLFLDHDDAGRMTTDFFLKRGLGSGLQVQNCSGVYQDFKDFNEMLCHSCSSKK